MMPAPFGFFLACVRKMGDQFPLRSEGWGIDLFVAITS
jgi:hypothetical protein